MAYFAAGHLAELIDSETPAETGFDGLLEVFFKELGDLDVLDDEAGRKGQEIGDDVYELGQLIATSDSRDQGCADFQAASGTIDLLTGTGKRSCRARPPTSGRIRPRSPRVKGRS